MGIDLSSIEGVKGFDGFFQEGAKEVLLAENTNADTRDQIACESYFNYDPENSPELMEALGEYEQFTNKQDWLFEHPRRRRKWAFLFQKGQTFKGGKNALVRRVTESCLDTTWMTLVQHLEQLEGVRSARRALSLGPQKFMETIGTSHIDPFVRNALPVTRRAVPATMFRSLFQVVPVRQPSSKYPFLKRRYADAHVGGQHGLIGNAADAEVWPYNATNLNRYYAGGRISGQLVGTGNGATTDFDLSYTPTYNHQVYLNGVLQTSGFTINAGAGTGGVDQLSFTVAPGAAVEVRVTYDTQQEGQVGRKMDLTIELFDIDVQNMWLSASSHLFAEQDAQAYHGVNLNSEIPRMLREEIYTRIDAQSTNDCLNKANAGDTQFDVTGYLPGDTDSAARRHYDKRIYEAIVESSQDLFELHRRWPTYIACGSGFAERLLKLEEYIAAPQSMSNARELRTEQRVNLGSIGGRWKIYQDPNLPANRAFLGWRSSSPFYVGLVITMFLPFYITPKVWKNSDDAPNLVSGRTGVCRYGRVMVDDTQYSTMTLQNL